MKEILEQFSFDYEKKKSGGEVSGNEQNSAYNPIVFILIGDKLQAAIDTIKINLGEKWNNAKEILYFSISSNKEEEEDNVYSFRVNNEERKKEILRADIYESFINNEEQLIDLNKKIVKIKNKILELGKSYIFCERVTISIMTRADDPMNIITIPMSLLLKSKFEETFKIVNCDLYEVLCENGEADNAGYSSAVAMSFFKEIEYAQSKEFNFEENINVIEEGIRLPVKNSISQLFDNIYLLGDRNEKGYVFNEPLKKNYESIAYLHILKNRNLNSDIRDEINQRYEENSFKRGISGSSYRTTYISAGISKVKRPDMAIAAVAIESFYENLLKASKELANVNKEVKTELFSIDKESLEEKTKKFIADEKKLEDMKAIMPLVQVIKAAEIENMPLKKIEEKLYGNGCIDFFQSNFREKAYNDLKKYDIGKEIKTSIMENIVQSKNYGIYCGYLWTSEDGILKELKIEKQNLEKEIEEKKIELDEIYNGNIDLPMQYLLPFFLKRAVNKAKEEILIEIYKRKLKILKIEIKYKILDEYEQAIVEIHNDIEKYIKELEDVFTALKENSIAQYNALEYSTITYAKENTKNIEAYSGQNIKLYYSAVVSEIIKELQKQLGKNFYFDDKFLGNLLSNLSYGKQYFLEKIIKNCMEYVFAKEPFLKSFEDEMQSRATVSTDYNNNKVLSKKEIFERLYEFLDESSRPSVYLTGFQEENRYEEKYIFGDYNSDFIKYAFDYDKSSRIYKLGCVHENNANGTVKLTLMGGFFIENLMYYKNSSKYYEVYMDKGFKLHCPLLYPKINQV